MTTNRRDNAERLLDLATAGLPATRAEWGAAMRAELAAIDDVRARWRFARSAAAAAATQGLGLRIAFGLGAAVLVAAITLIASRLQLPDGGPGVLTATVPLPVIPLLLAGLLAARLSGSFRFGVETGVLALIAGFCGLFAVLAIEGLVWMDLHGVFMLDGDPPKFAAGPADVVFDLLATGMWIGHLAFWLPWPVLGAAIGTRISPHRAPAPGPIQLG